MRLEYELAAGVLLILAAIVVLGLFARRMHRRTHQRVDRVHDRVRALGDALELEDVKDRKGLRELRMIVYKHVRDGLEFIRGLQRW
jgi:hypothetical protein